MAKILIIEDEEPMRNALVTKLTKEGFAVDIAGNGKEGLERITQQKPDLVLLDILMPTMDGKEFLKKLRSQAEYSSIPVIVLTNINAENDKIEMYNYGILAYLVKSDSGISDIVDIIRNKLTNTV